MSFVEPGQQRVIGPDPVGPADPPRAPDNPEPEVPETAPITDTAPDSDTFDREYVVGLRAEAAKYRTQLREYEADFEGVDPEQRKLLAQFARLSLAAENGDEDAIAQLQEFYADEPPVEQESQAAVTQVEKPMTEERFRELAREEAQNLVKEQQQIQNINSVLTRAKEWGFETTPGAKGYDQYQRLCYIAINDISQEVATNGDVLAAAKDQYEAERADERRQIIEDYLSGKEADTEGSLLVAGSNGAPGTRQPLWDSSMSEKEKFARVREATGEMFRAARGA